MKRIILLLAMLGMFQFSAQALVQGTIKPGAANSFKVTIKNIAAAAITGNFAQYNVAIRVAQTSPSPALSVSNLMAIGTVTLTTTYVSGGYTYYNIFYEAPTGTPNNVSMAQNVEMDIMSGTLIGGTGSAQVDLVDTWMFTDATATAHTGTGINQFTQFYINIQPSGPNGDATNYAARFYANGQSTAATNAAGASFVGLISVPLAVNFTRFEATKDNGAARITWSTGSELNNAGFDIERSTDGKSFTKIGSQNSKATNGTSAFSLDYSYRDEKSVSGTNYYRLKQISKEGSVQYSNVVSLTFENIASIKIYPNPATDQVTIEGEEVKAIAVYNLAGQMINVPVSYGMSRHNIITSGLSKGSYTIRITTAAGNTTHKLVLQ